ncbi:MAG: ATP-binding cassette domain-containing protein [Muribaculaceae bacterium]|nr:ATP-binding cassette domain-containing protein [Muribaculaceae bacterium]
MDMVEEVFRAVNVTGPSDRLDSLHNMNISLRRGEVLGLFGNHYSGRDKLFSIITGTSKPGSGTVSWRTGEDGKRPVTVSISLHSVLNGKMTIWENLVILFRNYRVFEIIKGRYSKKLIRTLFSDYGFGFALEEKVEDLTQMERLLLEIFVARHRKAKILLIDGSDIDGTVEEYSQLAGLLDQLKKSGMAILYFNSVLKPVVLLSDRIAFIDKGSIVKVAGSHPGSLEQINRIVSALYDNKNDRDRRQRSSAQEILSISDLRVGNARIDSLTLRKGELTAVVSPHRDTFEIFQNCIDCGTRPGEGTVLYQGKALDGRRRTKKIYMLDMLYLDKVIAELPPLDNLMIGLREKISAFGVIKPASMRFIQNAFSEWYGDGRLMQQADCRFVQRKDRVAMNLFRILLLHPGVVICNDFSIHNDIQTLKLVKRSFIELLDQGTAICMITSDLKASDDLVDRYIVLNGHYNVKD